MLTFNMKLEAFKKGFIDTTKKKVERGVDRGLIHMGGFIKKVAQRSIKDATKHTKKMQKTFLKGHGGEVYSRPNHPPLNKTGLLKKYILSTFYASGRYVKIGPAKLNGRGNVPSALEHGGVCKTLSVQYVGGRRTYVPRTFYMEKRPYMKPALREALKPKNKKTFFGRLTVPSTITIMQGL